MSPDQKSEQIIEKLRSQGVLRPSDLDTLGIDRSYLQRLYESGRVERIARGLYKLPDTQVAEHHTLAEVARLVPRGTVCLLSALRFHELTTQSPREVWIAIGNKDWKPQIPQPKLRIVRFSGDALTAGIETHEIEGISIKIYSISKTIADCFKYRHKIGLDVCLEALREAQRERRVTMDDLWRYAGICRVANVMRPYLESLV